MQDGCGLQIAVVWDDEWMIELEIVAASDRFSGRCEVYADSDWLQDLAAKFRGFPKSREDHFRTELGDEAYRRVVMESFCTVAAGHSALAVGITDNSPTAPGPALSQEAHVVIPFEPAAADEFAAALERIAADKTGSAHLRCIR